MVDDGLLELGGTTSIKLSLVAVAYHNKAVDCVLDNRVRKPDNSYVFGKYGPFD